MTVQPESKRKESQKNIPVISGIRNRIKGYLCIYVDKAFVLT